MRTEFEQEEYKDEGTSKLTPRLCQQGSGKTVVNPVNNSSEGMMTKHHKSGSQLHNRGLSTKGGSWDMSTE